MCFDMIHLSPLQQSISFFMLTLGLEFLPSHKLTLVTIKEWWNRFQHNNSSFLEPLLKSSLQAVTLDFDEDRDVRTERNRVLSGSIENAIIYLRNLRKVFLFLFG